MCRVDYIVLDLKVLIDEIRRIANVCMYPSNLAAAKTISSGFSDFMNISTSDWLHRSSSSRVRVIIPTSRWSQFPTDSTTYHSSMTCNKNLFHEVNLILQRYEVQDHTLLEAQGAVRPYNLLRPFPTHFLCCYVWLPPQFSFSFGRISKKCLNFSRSKVVRTF